jgi:ABC-type branched-subunit amino acid transport system ATPase component
MDGIGVLIPILGIMCGMLAIWTHHQRRMARIQAQAIAEKAAQNTFQNTELEERMRVLERIVTDKGYDVATQIEALRDARKVDALLDQREKEQSR